MSKGKWILLNGEKDIHKCNLPWSLDVKGMSATHLQKRHSGSIWKCECKLKYEWSGKKWRTV